MVIENFHERFTVPIPMLLDVGKGEIALELKPYLQPFERELAIRELRALIKPKDQIREENGYWLAKTNVPEDLLISKLTYWQRLGRKALRPTLQKALEFTQNGTAATRDKVDLHKARRLRYGPHDLHEYRGKFFPQLVRSLINMSGLPT